MLFPILIAIASVVVLFVIVALMQSTDFRVSRSVKVKASTATAFEQVNDLHLMNAWNPWLKLDPNIKQTYSGAEAGVGAVYDWDGNKNVGAGRQTIVETCPPELVRMKLEFFRPFAGVNEVQFTCVPEGDHTVVTWNMTGQRNFIMKAMGLFCSMEKMCGDSFLEGLADMKKIVEA